MTTTALVPGAPETMRPLIERVLQQIDAFIAALGTEQLAALHQPYDARTTRAWSNLPEAVLDPRQARVGLSTSTLTPSQWTALNGVLQVLSGSAAGTGADRIAQHLAADDHLLEIGGRYGYGRDRFRVALLGDPGRTGRWQFQFGGHHLAVAHTFRDGELVGATPSFRGIEPFGAFDHDGRRHEPEGPSWRALVAVLDGLDGAQRARARLVGSHPDLLLGPGHDWVFPTRREGLAGRDLTAAQRVLLREAVGGYVADIEDGSAARILEHYVTQFDDTYLGWSGSTRLSAPGDYVRIDGPSVWIELSMQDGVVTTHPHPHAVWRDRHTDYGGQ